MITPFGSAVAPEVNRISAVSSRETGRDWFVPSKRAHSTEANARRDVERRRSDLIARSSSLPFAIALDPLQQIGRSTVIDRHDDGSAQHAAPERSDPFRPVFAPEQHRIALADARDSSRRAK